MITQSGIYIGKYPDPNCPTAEDIVIQSSRITRFGGSIWCPLLYHHFLVGALAYYESNDPKLGIWGCLHDAHEVCTGEVVAPFKPKQMKEEQEWLDVKIASKFGVLEQVERHEVSIKRFDWNACDLEAYSLCLPGYEDRAIMQAKERRGYTIEGIFKETKWITFMHQLYVQYEIKIWQNRMLMLLQSAEQGSWTVVDKMFKHLIKGVKNAEKTKRSERSEA